MLEEITEFDAIIIGGGIAGCAASIWLARANKRVLLLEKEVAAHHKVCGEFISIETMEYLKELGLDLVDLGAVQVDNIRLRCGNNTVIAPLPFQAASLSRFVLDEALLQSAIAAGVQVRRGSTVTDLTFTAPYWSVTCANDKIITADAIFLATGKHNLRGWPRRGGKQNDLIGLKMHFRLTPEQHKNLENDVEIILFDGGYAGFEPIENGLANLCLVIKKSIYQRHRKNWRFLLENLMTSCNSLSRLLQDATACWEQPLAIFGVPYGFVFMAQADDHPNLYRLGDQMAVIPSFSGDGMAVALRTASLAVKHYQDGSAKTYHRQARRQLTRQIWFCTRISQLMIMSWPQKIMLKICQWRPILLTTIAAKTRLHL